MEQTLSSNRKVGKKVLVAERYEQILRMVDEKGSIRVSELSRQFGVTEETIRRDLDQLEKANKLRRSHGGAVSLKQEKTESPYFEREIKNIHSKRKLAKEAVNYVEENDNIILDASSTAWYMAKELPDIPLTILTNSIKVAAELSDKGNIQVVSTGGLLSSRSLSFVGPLAERSLDEYHVDKAFLSCQGIHLKRGLSDSNELQAHLKQKIIEVADSVYLLVDHSKFGVQSFARIAGWKEIDKVLTDAQAKAEDIQQLKEMQVNVQKLME